MASEGELGYNVGSNNEKTNSSGTSGACLLPAARKCSVKDGYKQLKKKVAENYLDKNDSNMLLATSFLIVRNKVS